MLFVLLGTIIAGVGAGGVAVIFYKYILRRPRPKGAIPIAAGLAMIAMQIILDYGWYRRATADFGADVVVLQTAEGKSPLQPLSYIIPRTDRFLALNKTTMRSNDTLPGIKLAEVFQVQKDGPTSTILQLIDCPGKRRADWSGSAAPSPDDLNDKAKWFDLTADDPLLAAACES
nr:hypothetical protein [uncultured Cohaesibacter sp.]